MEKIEFNVGSIVRPLWDDEARGKVIEVDGQFRTVEWFEKGKNENRDSPSRWHYTNLKFVTPKEEKMYTLKCKPVPNALEIQDGGWKYVVVNRHENKIVAAFISEMEAEVYVQSYSGLNMTELQSYSGVFYIREVDNGQ